MIFYSYTIYRIDTLDPTDALYVMFDSTSLPTMPSQSWRLWNYTKYYRCGVARFPENILYVTGKKSHSSSSLSLKFIMENDGPSSGESIGFRDVSILLAQVINPPTDTLCVRSEIDLLSSMQCICPTGQYADQQGSCRPCHTLCMSCFGSSASECYRCILGAWFNGSACTLCHISCTSCYGPNIDMCLECPVGKFLYNGRYCIDNLSVDSKFPISDCRQGLGRCDISKYLGWDNSCLDVCDPPFIQNLSILSYRACMVSSTISNVVLAQEIANTAMFWSSNIISIVKFSNPASMFLSLLTDMLIYLRYLNINYPTNLQYVLDSNTTLSINVIPNVPDRMQTAFENSTLPSKFEKYDFPSSFIINFWEQAIVMVGMIVVVVLVTCLANIFKRVKIVGSILNKLRQSLRWNFALLTFITYYGEIVLYSSLEFKSRPFMSRMRILSFVLCLCINLFSLLVFIRMVVVINTVRKSRSTLTSTTLHTLHVQLIDKWKDYRVLFEPYKTQSTLSQMFVPLFTTRLYLFYLVIAYLEQWPLAQMILILFLNVAMIVYLISVRPHDSRLETIECIVEEVIILVVNTCVLTLAVLDKLNLESKQLRNTLGFIVVAINTGFLVGGSFYIILKMIVACVKYCMRRRSGNSTPSQLALTPQIIHERSNLKQSKEAYNNGSNEQSKRRQPKRNVRGRKDNTLNDSDLHLVDLESANTSSIMNSTTIQGRELPNKRDPVPQKQRAGRKAIDSESKADISAAQDEPRRNIRVKLDKSSNKMDKVPKIRKANQ